MRHLGWLLGLGAVVAVAAAPALDEQAKRTLREEGLSTHSDSVLAALKARTVPSSKEEIAKWIVRLGDDDFEVREEATRQLKIVGSGVRKQLEAVRNDDDSERARRARECLRAIDNGDADRITLALLHVLASNPPEGTLEAALAFVPHAHRAMMFEALASVLERAGIRDGKADAALLKALEDEHSLRRALATVVLGRMKGLPHRALIRSRMRDSDFEVRFLAASALLRGGDRHGLGTMVTLLEEGPIEVAYRAETFLFEIGGVSSPEVALVGDRVDARKASRTAWQKWLDEHGETVDLAKLGRAKAVLGVKLVCELKGGKNGSGRVFEYGPDNKIRWEIHDVKGPIDAQLAPNGRVLLAELHGNRVTERDRAGNITFEVKVNDGPMVAQPLPNGNVFIATYQEILEVTRTGKKLYSYRVEEHQLYYAKWLPNRRVLYVGTNKEIVELDPRTKRIYRKIPAGDTSNWGSVEPLPNGNFIVCRCSKHTVVEITPEGKDVWSVSIQWPTWAIRLPNGHTLVACAESGQVVQFDRAGKQVWREALGHRPCRCRLY